MSPNTPRAADHREAVALFRHGVIGPLLTSDFEHGDLRAQMRTIAMQRRRPPGSDHTRTYGVSTIERWYYAYRADGLDGLKPSERSDSGRGRTLTDEQRTLLLEVRREHPSASAPLILRTLVSGGLLQPGTLSAATLNRLYADHSLQRAPRKAPPGQRRRRLRWAMAQPGMLWHADVCHGPKLAGAKTRIKIHAMLDDHSRYVVALEVCEREREVDMLEMFGRAIVRHGRPESVYFDNGPTYTGDALAAVCGRLKIGLQHARPYDPQARGKMERLWRTLREQCLDYIDDDTTIHDVRVRVNAWLDEHYHRAPHAGLLGKTPESAFAGGESAHQPVDGEMVAHAFSTRAERRVRKDGTLDIDGVPHEVDAGFLAGKRATLVSYLPPVAHDTPPYIEHDGKRFAVTLVDAVANASTRRTPLPQAAESETITNFNPPQTVLDLATGRLQAPEETR